MLYHNVKIRDVVILEGLFATLTPNGWVIPDWLKLLRHTVRI